MNKTQDDHKDKPKVDDGLSDEQLQSRGGTDYAYLDKTRDLHIPIGAQGDGVPSSVLNPAYYPKDVKPEALHGENEKAGATFPTDPKPEDVEDRSRTSEQIQQEYEAARPYLKDGEAKDERTGTVRRDVPPANVAPLREENQQKL